MAAEDAARYRDALGASLPLGLPAAFTEPVERPLEQLVARYARTHGPFDGRRGRPAVRPHRSSGSWGRCGPGGRGPGGAGRVPARRRGAGVVRHRGPAPAPAALARRRSARRSSRSSPRRWPGSCPPGRASARVAGASRPWSRRSGVLQGAAIPASPSTPTCCPLRVQGYRPADLDALCTSGDLVWIGAGGSGPSDGKVRLFFRDQVAAAGSAPRRRRPTERRAARRPPGAPRRRGACFWTDLLAAAPGATDLELLTALWDLVWAGEVTNDSLAPLRAFVGGATAKRRRRRRRAGGALAPAARPAHPAGPARGCRALVAGRARCSSRRPRRPRSLHARACSCSSATACSPARRRWPRASRVGSPRVYGVLKALEDRGQVRRGYFVAGLGAAQFALPGAVDRLRVGPRRRCRRRAPRAGRHRPRPSPTAPRWRGPTRRGRPAAGGRSAGGARGRRACAWLDRRGHHLLTFPAAATPTTRGSAPSSTS